MAQSVIMSFIPGHLEDKMEMAVQTYRRENPGRRCREALISIHGQFVRMVPGICALDLGVPGSFEQIAYGEVVVQ
jgi:hypothetical protein